MTSIPNASLPVWPVLVLLLSICWTGPASAFSKEHQAFLKATDVVLKAVDDHRKAARALIDHQQLAVGQPALARDSKWRQKDSQLRAQVTALSVRAKRAKAAQGKALEALKKALQPYSALRTKALRSVRAIRAGGGHQANRQAAQATIVRDINKLNGPVVDRYMGAIKAAQDLIKAGRPQETLKSAIVDALKDVPIGKEMADALMDVVNDLYKDNILSNSDRLKLFEERLGKASKVLKALNILNGGTETKFGDETLNQLVNIFDLALDFVPSDGSLAGVKAYALYQKSMLENIVKSVEGLNMAIASRNLDALVAGAGRFAHLDRKSKWLGLTPGQLFGDIEVTGAGNWFVRIAPAPGSPIGEKYVVGDAVPITFGWKIGKADKSWLWVGLADNGDPRSYFDARQEYRTHIRAYPQSTDAYRLQKTVRPVMYKAGTYEARVYVDRQITIGGRTRLIRVGKTVKFEVYEPPWAVWLNRTDYVAGDRVRVFYLARRNTDRTFRIPSIAIMPPSIAHGSTIRNLRFALARQILRRTPRGILTFTAPANASKYDLRLYNGRSSRDGYKEVAHTSFFVVPTPTPKIDLDKEEILAGEDLKLNYEASKGYARTAFIGVFSIRRRGYGLNETPTPAQVSPFSSWAGRGYRFIGGTEAGHLNLGSYPVGRDGGSQKYTVRMFDSRGGKQVAMKVFVVKQKPRKPSTVRATFRGKTATKGIR